MDDNIQKPEFTKEEIESAVEAMLFAAGHPLPYDRMGKMFGMTPAKMRDFIKDYAARYNGCEIPRGVLLLTYDDSAQLCTKEEYIGQIRDILGIRRGGNLSHSSMETLAVIAYNQPATRAYVDTVRGVDSSYAVNSLLERGLIESRGRVDAPGRPMLYGTTEAFLRCFGLNSLSELPDVGDDTQLLGSLENMTIDDIAESDDGNDDKDEEKTEEIPAETPAEETSTEE